MMNAINQTAALVVFTYSPVNTDENQVDFDGPRPFIVDETEHFRY